MMIMLKGKSELVPSIPIWKLKVRGAAQLNEIVETEKYYDSKAQHFMKGCMKQSRIVETSMRGYCEGPETQNL